MTIVVPSLSIKAEPPVAVVDAKVDAKGTRKVAEAYLNFLYTPEAQKLIAQKLLSSVRPEICRSEGPRSLCRCEADRDRRSVVRRLGKAQPKHFAEGGIFDQIYQPKSTNMS